MVKKCKNQLKYNKIGLFRKRHTLLRNPKNAPTKVNGTEMPNQSASRATRMPNEIAPELPLLHNTKLRTKNTPKTMLEKRGCLNDMR